MAANHDVLEIQRRDFGVIKIKANVYFFAVRINTWVWQKASREVSGGYILQQDRHSIFKLIFKIY
ncbi:hypothetical protein CPter291_2454 [Collimonas pratensis]|uniref:Uncharacterized protein n=1 Tax=Collimonas pratensis TaxID=279113 RepID=A0ABM5Z6F2_9BURK|nr:hypothetical protein CPter291_2454 [Collimonas pratensis]